jgi:hypothetical protein
MNRSIREIKLDAAQLPRELRELGNLDTVLLALISEWSWACGRTVLDTASLLDRIACGLRAVQAMAEAEASPAAAADRLLRELA